MEKIAEIKKRNVEKLLEEVLNKIKPSKEEREKIQSIANSFISLLRKKKISCFIGGSVGKDTFLRNLKDIDIYLLMNDEEELEDIKNKLFDLFDKIYVLKGSREYFHIWYKDFLFECIPILNIDKPENAVNTTDISKFHVEFVKSKIKENSKLREEILLLKYFLKQKELYGAESYIKGFSGYLSEVLVIHFGSFLNVLCFFSKIKELPVNIGVNNVLLEEFKKRGKINDYFNISDPVLISRNLGMAVSKENFYRLIFESKKFLNNFNFKREDKYEKLKRFWINNKRKLEKGYRCCEIKLNLEKLYLNYFNWDIVGSKVLKLKEKIERELKEKMFGVVRTVFKINKEKKEGRILLITTRFSLIKIHKGPHILRENIYIDQFLKKYEKDFVEVDDKGFCFSFIFSDQNIMELIEKLIKEEFGLNFEFVQL